MITILIYESLMLFVVFVGLRRASANNTAFIIRVVRCRVRKIFLWKKSIVIIYYCNIWNFLGNKWASIVLTISTTSQQGFGSNLKINYNDLFIFQKSQSSSLSISLSPIVQRIRPLIIFHKSIKKKLSTNCFPRKQRIYLSSRFRIFSRDFS